MKTDIIKGNIKSFLQANPKRYFARGKVPNALHAGVEQLVKRKWLIIPILSTERETVTLALDILPWLVIVIGCFGLIVNDIHNISDGNLLFAIAIGVGSFGLVGLWSLWTRISLLRAVKQRKYAVSVSIRDKGQYALSIKFRSGDEAVFEI